MTAPSLAQTAIHQSEDGTIVLDVAVRDESVWLSQAQMGAAVRA